ncbi:putative serine/threonine-protein kinase ATG1a [Paratrimastix pyriformis]|uniref:Serine/threonine-protein kinase ATG1a n=1 Tax=Paratrimastix pyriformis TaxID=342808 RepID=A0ABQ8UZL6_9EUKA|nr:putative serine/threonine-protein kinase ATG1a [Paratrimastix pyriformis]
MGFGISFWQSWGPAHLGQYIGPRIRGRLILGIIAASNYLLSGHSVAIKRIDKHTINAHPRNLTNLDREIKIFSALGSSHPNVCRFDRAGQDRLWYYLVMEYCDAGDLAGLLAKRGRLSEAEARGLLGQLSSAMLYMWSRSCYHRDLKPANLLLSSDPPQAPFHDFPFTVKLCDFGLSHEFHMDYMSQTHCGTPFYMAPEVIAVRPGQRYDYKADLWSMGIILYEMLCGQKPYNGRDQVHMAQLVASPPVIPSWAVMSAPARDLIMGLLTPDPERRMDMRTFQEHPFFGAHMPVPFTPAFRFPKGMSPAEVQSCQAEIDKARADPARYPTHPLAAIKGFPATFPLIRLCETPDAAAAAAAAPVASPPSPTPGSGFIPEGSPVLGHQPLEQTAIHTDQPQPARPDPLPPAPASLLVGARPADEPEPAALSGPMSAGSSGGESGDTSFHSARDATSAGRQERLLTADQSLALSRSLAEATFEEPAGSPSPGGLFQHPAQAAEEAVLGEILQVACTQVRPGSRCAASITADLRTSRQRLGRHVTLIWSHQA